jgi:NAD(P)-dependent dehydrogenase (short-subunit alcohol dehydrogenase family)
MSDDKGTVLTTGANSGLGLAIALELARQGYRSVGSVRSEGKAETVARAAADAGVKVETVLLDVTDAEACERVMADLDLYALVNNAGYGLTGAVEDVEDDEVRAILETMVVAPMRLTRLALPHMRERRNGCIVNISSIYGRTTTPLTGWYQASKHALEAVSDALRIEVAGDGVRVVLIEPGGFNTGIWDDMERDVAKRAGSRFEAAYRRSQQALRFSAPLMGDPAQVATLVARVVGSSSPRPRYLVGADAQMMVLSDRITPTPLKDLMSRLTLGL